MAVPIPLPQRAGSPATPDPGPVPPYNDEAEQALLGALLLNNGALDRVADFLREEHFFRPIHGRLYGACRTLIENSRTASPVTLKAKFEHDPDLAALGGVPYLAELAGAAMTTWNVVDYGKLIHDLYLRRELIELGQTLIADAHDQSDLERSAALMMADAEGRLFNLAERGVSGSDFRHLRAIVEGAIGQAQAAFQRSSQVTGVTTGLTDLDRRLGGLQDSDLIILAGRPGMGKTALATNIAVNAARAYHESQGREGAGVAFFSLEMSAEQLATRVLADLAEVSSDKIRRGDVQASDFERFVRASVELSELPIYIDDTPGLSIGALRTRVRRLVRRVKGPKPADRAESGALKKPVGLVIVDYLQLLSGSGSGRSQENRVQEVAEITRGLKILAKELKVPVLALSQLSRKVEDREDKRPQLADLRESGSIEQDADVVMFVYRHEYYVSKDRQPQRGDNESEERYNDRYARWQKELETCANVAEVIVAKQRHGPTGTTRLHFDGTYTRFSDLAWTPDAS